MRAMNILCSCCLVLLITACATPATREAMDIPASERSQYSPDHFLTGKVEVGSVMGGQDTNPMWTSEIDNVEFEGALRSSLETAYLLSAHATAEYVLDAELIEIDQPMFGFTFTVESKIRYTLRNKSSRQTVMENMITANGTATTGDAFAGVKRLRIATERSAQENIKKMIDALYVYNP